MKTLIAALTALTAFNLLVEADWNDVKPRNIVMPVNSKYTAEEWQTIMAAQEINPEPFPEYKKGFKPQPDFAGKIHVPVEEDFAGKVHFSDAELRITNGQSASRGQFPWQVALFVDNSFFCGGSIISDQWILTAAHCVGRSYRVILGANRLDINEKGAVTVMATKSIVHSKYDPKLIRNDIALVQLPQPIQFTSFISPIRLPTYSDQGIPFVGETVRASGWGKTYDGANGISPILKFVDLTVITNTQCAQTFGQAITSTNLCVSTNNGRSTCNGDSGGPLIYKKNGLYVQVGIVSFGSTAGCERGYPAAFTRVTSYLKWIETNTGISIRIW